MILSKRLETSAQYTKGFDCLADCGTDHAYLPIYCVSQSYVKKAIASDNKVAPLNHAKRHIKQAGLELEIKTILADGLPYLDPSIDVVSILGMGGNLMFEILANADLLDVKRLILSPNSDPQIIREFLLDHGFCIIDERLIDDHGKFYQIIVAEHGEMMLNDREKEFGPIIIKRKSEPFKRMIEKQLKQLRHALPNIKNPSEQEKVKERIELLKEVLL